MEPPATRQRHAQLHPGQGRRDLIPELTYTLAGVKGDIDAIIWHGGNVQHSLSADSGYTMSLELESQLHEDTLDELADGSGDYTGVLAWYRDAKTGEQRKVTAGYQARPKRLTYLYTNKVNAQRQRIERCAKWNSWASSGTLHIILKRRAIMEGFIDLLQQLNTALPSESTAFFLTLAVIVGAIGKAIFSLKGALDFHNEYFVKKRIKRITELKALIKEDRPLAGFLDQSLETESFRVDSGITASPAKMNALIEIHDTGLWTIPQLRNAARHLVIDSHTLKASIEITKADIFGAWASMVFAILLVILGAGYFVALAVAKDLLGFLVGAAIFGTFVMVAHLVAQDYRAYQMALRMDAQLKIAPTGEEPPPPAP